MSVGVAKQQELGLLAFTSTTATAGFRLWHQRLGLLGFLSAMAGTALLFLHVWYLGPVALAANAVLGLLLSWILVKLDEWRISTPEQKAAAVGRALDSRRQLRVLPHLPDEPEALVRSLANRGPWRHIDAATLRRIFWNADGDSVLIKTFVHISEHLKVVGQGYAPLQMHTVGGTIPAEFHFSQVLRKAGADRLQRVASFPPVGPMTQCAQEALMAFEGAVMCDPANLMAYYGPAALYAVSDRRNDALEWCARFRRVEHRLSSEDPGTLTPCESLWARVLNPDAFTDDGDMVVDVMPGFAQASSTLDWLRAAIASIEAGELFGTGEFGGQSK